MKRFSLLLIAVLAVVYAFGQDVPRVGESSADEQIVRWSQMGWRPEGASLSYDGLTLYVSLKKAPREVHDIYMSEKKNGRWQVPMMVEELTSDWDDIDPSLAADGGMIYFVRKDRHDVGTKKEYEESNLYAAERQPDGSWQVPQKMVISNGHDRLPYMLADNVTMFFTSARDSKNAVEKRYMIRRVDKYNWTLPEEVTGTEDELRKPIVQLHGKVTRLTGTSVNRAGGETVNYVDVYDVLTQRKLMSCKTDQDGNYKIALRPDVRYMVDAYADNYSHAYNWINTFGVSQDSVAEWDVELARSLQIHLSTYDQENRGKLNPTVDVSKLTGQTKSRLVGQSVKKQANGDYVMTLEIGQQYEFALRCEGHVDTTMLIDTKRDVRFVETALDMYMRAGKVRAELMVVDKETHEKISTQATWVNLTMEEEPMVVAVENGIWKGDLRCATQYKMVLNAPGYLYNDTLFITPANEQVLPLNMMQEALRTAITVQLRNILFEFNSFLLKDESYEELRKVAQLMRDNPSLRIEVSAHTDDVGSDAYNQRLSQRRAESVTDYLVKQEGIERSRIEGKGYGKTKPLVPNDSDENRAINRRVEFEILGL